MAEKPTYEELERRIREFERKESERARIEEALKESGKELFSIYHNSSNIMILVDEDRRVLRANQLALESVGRQIDEIVGLRGGEALRCVHSIDRAGCGFGVNCKECIVRNTVLDSLGTGHPHYNVEAPVQLFIDDEIVDLYFLISTAFLNVGGKKSVLICLEDITERKRTQNALRESEERYRHLFENMTSGVAIYEITENGEDFIFKDFNKAAEEIEKVRREDLLGKRISDVFPGAKRFGILDVLQRVFETGQSEYFGPRLYSDDRDPGTWREAWVYKLSSGEIVAVYNDITAQQISEEIIKKNEKLFRTIFDQAPVGIAIIDSHTGRFLHVNEAYCRIVGYNRSEMLAADFMQITHPDDLREDLDNMASLRAGKITRFKMEKRYICKEGQIVWVSLTVASLWGENGGNFKHIAIVENITERKASFELTQRLAAIVHSTQDAIISKQLDGTIITWNRGAEKMYGYLAREAIGRNVSIVVPEHLREETEQFMETIRSGNPVPMHETLRRTKNGQLINVMLTLSPIHDENNRVSGASATAIDITEKKKSERKIRENEKKLTNLLQTIQTAVVTHDADGRIVDVNSAAEKFFGVYNKQLVGLRPTDSGRHFVSETGEPLRMDEYPENIVKKTQRPLTDYVIGLKKSEEDSPTWVLINASPQFHENGNLKEIIISAMDITELKRIQVKLLEKESQIFQAQKMEAIGNLAGGIAHDFNNILSSIIGFTELALDDVEKETPVEESLKEVYAAGKRARELVKRILTFARRTDEEEEPIEMADIVKEVLKFIRSAIPTTIEIRQNIKSASLIMGNPTQLHQVLMNLCTNSAHAMEDKGGTLEVDLEDLLIDRPEMADAIGVRPGEYIRIRLSDTGVGISPDIIESIFEPYFTTKAPGKGTGMGLAMVHSIVENYGGKITVDSELGKGTVVTIYLPIAKKRKLFRQYETEQLPEGTESILFVDDEPSIARMGSQVLERLGYSVTTRTNSIEALALFQANADDFDLLITDMTMPNLTGDQLAVEVMKKRPDISVILCTGYSKKISDESAAEIGIKAFAYKPMVMAELAKTVRKVLDEAKSEKQG